MKKTMTAQEKQDRMNAIRNMKMPAHAPRLDINVNSIDEASGKVLVNIINRDNDRTIAREYDSIDKARMQAIFIASTLGIESTRPDILDEWLTWRGFPGLDSEQKSNQ
jgi:hypothetical protein